MACFRNGTAQLCDVVTVRRVVHDSKNEGGAHLGVVVQVAAAWLRCTQIFRHRSQGKAVSGSACRLAVSALLQGFAVGLFGCSSWLAAPAAAGVVQVILVSVALALVVLCCTGTDDLADAGAVISGCGILGASTFNGSSCSGSRFSWNVRVLHVAAGRGQQP